MNILSIESASTVCGVALFINNRLINMDEIDKSRIHGKRLPVSIHKLLSTHALEVNHLDAIAVSSGPGSYTGLRIGMSLAKGLATVAKIPIIPVPTLHAMNVGISQKRKSYWVLLHSHKDKVFAQRFFSGKAVSEIEFEIFRSNRYDILYGFNLQTVCSELNYYNTPPSARYVGEIAIKNFDEWSNVNIDAITLNYITNFNIVNNQSL
ncbi:uncharacterized protein METZ01_LOCUS400836 [marine metagenome]|uniref:Gcp-like domain-containing protein n=1 Tax=marine metagenome TaxID=408172 RepID=A0A382VN78_9ZZZZ